MTDVVVIIARQRPDLVYLVQLQTVLHDIVFRRRSQLNIIEPTRHIQLIPEHHWTNTRKGWELDNMPFIFLIKHLESIIIMIRYQDSGFIAHTNPRLTHDTSIIAKLLLYALIEMIRNETTFLFHANCITNPMLRYNVPTPGQQVDPIWIRIANVYECITALNRDVMAALAWLGQVHHVDSLPLVFRQSVDVEDGQRAGFQVADSNQFVAGAQFDAGVATAG